MNRVWDIQPPKPRRYTHHKEKKQKQRAKNLSVFFMLLLVILVVAFIFGVNKTSPNSVDGISTSAPVKLITTATPTPSLSAGPKSANELLIKIINGSGRSEETDEAVTLVSTAGFKVEKSETALNLYDSSIIYYQGGQEQHAKDIAKSLDKFKPKLQQFSQQTTFDIIVVIGAR